jgi:SAM-dependent methyltransferase
MPDFTDSVPLDEVACPICDTGRRFRVADTVWEAPEAVVCRCSGCGVVFLHPIMTDDEEASFYKADFAHYMRERGGAGETKPAEHFEKNAPEAARRLELLRPYLAPNLRVLELGSSTGFLLDAIAPHVGSVTGVEPGENYADYANGRGVKTYPDLSALAGEQFDLVLAYYVVEHLKRPVERLGDLRAMLKPGGRIALEVPNVDDALVTLYALESFDGFYWQKANYFYYSAATTRLILERAGFGDIELIPEQRYDISNHLHWLRRGEPGGKGRYAHIFDERLNAEYARCLREQWICDTVFAVAGNPA